MPIVKTIILKKLGQLAWLGIITFVVSVIAGTTLYVFAAFTEPTAAPGASDQDFTENIMGANNADNDYESDLVAASSTGSIIERLEYVQNNLHPAYGDDDANYVLGTASNPGVALKNTWNGTSTTDNFPQSVGGVDDYNNNNSLPYNAYGSTTPWTQCTAGNSYCSTNDSTACSGDVCWRDDSTGLVWSDYLDSGANHTWHWANNCDDTIGDGSCGSDGERACECEKLTSSKTGCEALGDGNWRLPHQKELMIVYVDGSWKNLPHAGFNYWAATTQSLTTQVAWSHGLANGSAGGYTKSSSNDTRCVR